MMRRQRAEPSVKVAMKDQNKIQSDLGLLPDTFVAPSGPNIPSLLSKSYFALRYHHLKRRLQDLMVMLIFKYTNRADGLKINYRTTKPTAQALHSAMYTAFAAKDTATLKRICCDGLYSSFVSRIAARPRGETWNWELVKHTKAPKIMSYRAASLGIERAGIRQAVVRLNTQQRLTRYRADGSVVPGTGEVKDVREYVVIQRILWQGVESEWQVWGTTEETTIEKVREAQAMTAGM